MYQNESATGIHVIKLKKKKEIIESQIFFSQNLVVLVFTMMEKNTESIQAGFFLYVT